MQKTMSIRLSNKIVHQRKAGAAPHENLFKLYAENISEQSAAGRQAHQLTVVSGLDSAVNSIIRINLHIQQPVREVKLVTAGLSPCHIQRQFLRFQLFIQSFLLSIKLIKLLTIHVVELHRIKYPFVRRHRAEQNSYLKIIVLYPFYVNRNKDY